MRRSRPLIVNADDFGLSHGVNAGIARAHRDGILTSATLLANGPAFDGAVAMAAENPALGVGIHLNLVRGRPLSLAEDVPDLVGADGCLKKFRLRRMSPRFLLQAEAEYRRQFEKILNAGIKPTHIDFEQHHAWRGKLYRLAARLASEYGIAAMRTLEEPVAWAVRRLGWPGWSRFAMAAAMRTGVTLAGGGDCLLHPDRLLGQSHIGGMTEDVWLRLLADLPGGVSEVMTHPGVSEPGGDAGAMGESWLGEARAEELAALVSPRVREAVDRSGARLITFRELLKIIK